MSKQPIIVAINSDIHIKSTLAMCPPEGVRLDDGGGYKPSKAQKWLWGNWVDYWGFVGRLRKQHKAKLYCVYNGDLFDGGAHHGTTQTISDHAEPDQYISERVFSVPGSLNPDRTYIVRGTEAHVGPSAQTEEMFAHAIRAEKDPENERWSFWHLRMEANGVRFDFQHHPTMRGSVPWTAPQACQRMAFRIWTEHRLRDLPHPHIAIRSHTHVHQDSGKAYPTRAIITPAWQLKTAHGHKVAADSISDMGGVVVLIKPDGQYEVIDRLYLPALPAMMGVA